MNEFVKICIITIPEREYYMSNDEFSDFVERLIPIFKKQFPETEFMFMSRELNVITTGLDDLEHLLFEIKQAIDELKRTRSDTSVETIKEGE